MFMSVTAPYAAVLGAACFLYFVVYPVVVYLRDEKGSPLCACLPVETGIDIALQDFASTPI